MLLGMKKAQQPAALRTMPGNGGTAHRVQESQAPQEKGGEAGSVEGRVNEQRHESDGGTASGDSGEARAVEISEKRQERPGEEGQKGAGVELGVARGDDQLGGAREHGPHEGGGPPQTKAFAEQQERPQ